MFQTIKLKDRDHAFKEVEEPNNLQFHSLPHFDYDPDGTINDHYKVVIYIKTFTQRKNPFNGVSMNIDSFDQEIERGKIMSVEVREKPQEFIENTYQYFPKLKCTISSIPIEYLKSLECMKVNFIQLL